LNCENFPPFCQKKNETTRGRPKQAQTASPKAFSLWRFLEPEGKLETFSAMQDLTLFEKIVRKSKDAFLIQPKGRPQKKKKVARPETRNLFQIIFLQKPIKEQRL